MRKFSHISFTRKGGLWLGALQYGIRAQKAKQGLCWVALPDLLVAEDVKIWYQSQVFHTEPGWAG
jgi:hypothetical protein